MSSIWQDASGSCRHVTLMDTLQENTVSRALHQTVICTASQHAPGFAWVTHGCSSRGSGPVSGAPN